MTMVLLLGLIVQLLSASKRRFGKYHTNSRRYRGVGNMDVYILPNTSKDKEAVNYDGLIMYYLSFNILNTNFWGPLSVMGPSNCPNLSPIWRQCLYMIIINRGHQSANTRHETIQTLLKTYSIVIPHTPIKPPASALHFSTSTPPIFGI